MKLSICIVLLLALNTASQAQTPLRDFEKMTSYQHLGIAAIGLGMAGVAKQFDNDVQGELDGIRLLEEPLDIANIYGSGGFNIPVSLGLWLGGKAASQQQLEHTGSALLRSLLYSQLIVAPIKYVVGRQRPDKSDKRSFPSGHTTNGFAMARVLHRSYGPYVGIPMYALGGFVAAARIRNDKHFLSDVVMGAAVGTIVGNSVTLRPSEQVSVIPVFTPEVTMLTLAVRLK